MGNISLADLLVGSVVEWRDGTGELTIGTVTEKGCYSGVENYIVVETESGDFAEILENDGPVWLVA